uniref:hypothetical protein n=1 Tax=Cephaleuros parasiticus TaxID=173370 RepID=UPI001EE0EFF8|nr:hypothetical protein MFQ79_pgp015 [Cephaleuros parasiticus]UIB39047.1 hypothetical protein [Cephaleuros parasiticus]
MQLKKTIKNSKNTDRIQNNNLLPIRLNYYRQIRRLRLIEYFKNAQIKPEWMIINLLPVLPPDLRPIISSSRGFITGDVNTLYQNILYKNILIGRLSRIFWTPKTLMNFEEIFSNRKTDSIPFFSVIAGDKLDYLQQ